MRHQDRRAKASELARAHGADVVGEFLISSGEDAHLPEHVWGEVLDLVRETRSTLLVVLRPDEIAGTFRDFACRIEDLEAADMRLVLPEPKVLLQSGRRSSEAGEAA